MTIKDFRFQDYKKCCATFVLYDDYAKYYDPDKGDKIIDIKENSIVVETSEQYYEFLINKFTILQSALSV